MYKWLLFLLMSIQILASNEFFQVPVEYNAHEIKIADSDLSRKIFRTLPGSKHQAVLAPELLIKNHRYFYCTREPEGEYNCYVYLNFNYDGALANFENDTDYGLGSLTEYYGQKTVLKDKAQLNFDDDYIELYMEGEIAKKLFEKSDLGETSYKRVHEVDIEFRIGRHIKCLKSYDPNKSSFEAYGCKVKIPIDPNKKKIEFTPNLN